MNQELLLKSRTPRADAAIEKTVRIVLCVAVAVYWMHETFARLRARAQKP